MERAADDQAPVTGDGPRAVWEQHFVCELPFPVHSKSNFRRGGQGSGDKWRAEQRFRGDVAVLAGAAMPQGWDPGDSALALPKRPAFAVVIVAASTLDTANLSKSVLDALEGVVFINDAQVRFEAALSERRRGDQRAVLAVARLVPGATVADLAAAGHALVDVATGRWDATGS